MIKETFPNTVQVIIDMLNHMDVDGETMQHILKETGMEYQMLGQLMKTCNIEDVEYFMRQRVDIDVI
jgi:hypothetical protein